MRIMMFLEVRSAGLHLSAGINGAPLVRATPDRKIGTRLPLNFWLMPGQNTVQVEFATSDRKGYPSGFEVRVTPADETVPSPVVFVWQMPPDVQFPPQKIELPFVPTEVPKTKLWGEATTFPKLEDTDRAAALAAALELRQAFQDQRTDRIMELLDYRLQEMVPGFEANLEEHKTDVRAQFGRMVLDDQFALKPFDPRDLKLVPCAGGRVFYVQAGNDELITTKETDRKHETTMPVFVAHVGGKWRVVR